MRATLPEFERAGVVIVGSVMLDRYWYGPTSRVSPGAPIPMVKADTIEERPGGTANVAMDIASLGANSRLVGLTGIDDAAHALSKTLTGVNVECDFISVPAHPTTTKLRVFSRNQQLICLDFEEDFGSADPRPLHERTNQALGSIGALVLPDYAKGVLASVQQMIILARRIGVSMLIDPKGTDFGRYRGATLLTPNLSELGTVAGKCKSEDELAEHGMKVIANLDLSVLPITRFEQGMALLQPGKSPLHMPTQAQEVYNVAGAGGTVIGVLAMVLAAGNSLGEACYFANAAIGVVVGKLGTSTISSIELENAVYGRVGTGSDVISESEPKQAIASIRKRGEKVVMINSMSNILHTGHVSYLANARKLGDRLIVAVNNDALTKRLKGEARPVNPLEQCMTILDTLEPVGRVVSLEEDTPQRLTTGILPDLLVKGGDHKPEQIADSGEVWADGGEVLMLNFGGGCSTTNIIKKVQKDSDK